MMFFVEGNNYPIDMVCTDVWYYGSSECIESDQLLRFSLSVDLMFFTEKIKHLYEQDLKELIDDDLMMNENYAQDGYGMDKYPSFQEILNTTEGSNKMEFVNDTISGKFLHVLVNDLHKQTCVECIFFIKTLDYIETVGQIVTLNGRLKQR